jgi:hypothetical protein
MPGEGDGEVAGVRQHPKQPLYAASIPAIALAPRWVPCRPWPRLGSLSAMTILRIGAAAVRRIH